MERRRINLDEEPQQRELPLASPPFQRRRLALEDVEAVTLRVTTQTAAAVLADPKGAEAFLKAEVERIKHPPLAGGFISKADAEDVNAHQDAIRAHAVTKAAVDGIAVAAGDRVLVTNRASGHDAELVVDKVSFLCDGYTEYSRQRPPSSGFWELKQRSAAAPDPHNWWYAAPINKWHRGVPQKDSRLAGFVDHATLMQSHEWRGMRKPWPEGYSYELERPAFAADFTPAPDTQKVEVVGKLDVTQQGAILNDLNPTRRRVAL